MGVSWARGGRVGLGVDGVDLGIVGVFADPHLFLLHLWFSDTLRLAIVAPPCYWVLPI